MKLIQIFLTRGLAATALTLAASALMAAPARAQATYNGPTAERSRDENERDLEDRIAYQRLRAALAANRRERKSEPKMAVEQLQEDFTRLQIVNKELVLTTSRSPELDLKFVSKSASEIHKRAERLMSNLALPDPEEGSKRPSPAAMTDQKQIRASITSLGWLIYRFAKNPLFKEAGVVETQSAARARRDLEEIIELSDQLKKSSDKLR